jgi:hypothetical protein
LDPLQTLLFNSGGSVLMKAGEVNQSTVDAKVVNPLHIYFFFSQ